MNVPLVCPRRRPPCRFWPLCLQLNEGLFGSMQSKRKSARPAKPSPVEGRAAFTVRPPSQAWERLSLAESPQDYVWAWFKPATAPNGVLLRIPDETYRDRPELAAQWTVRKFLQAAAIEPASVSAWLLNGVSYPALNGTSPYLDAPLPVPVAGANAGVTVFVGPPVAGPVVPPVPMAGAPPFVNGAPLAGVPPMVPVMGAALMPLGVAPPGATGSVPFAPGPMFQGATSAGLPVISTRPPATAAGPPQPLDAATADIFERIEADWNSSNEIEKDLGRVRKQLVDILGRLKALNRDLTPPERVHSNNQDKKDWQDARRTLRDATNRVWKYLKAHDIGDTSNAGKRVWFDEIYRKFIGPRRPFDELMASARAFELHRKTITQLHCDMSNAYSYASLDGERRAQQVLNRIQTKVREATNKKNFLGVILDS
jgi:hypothetical protein